MTRPLLYSAPMATPGPWRHDRRAILAPAGHCIAEVFSGGADSLEGADANGRLIAAAPALYVAALNAVLTLKHARTCVNPSEYAHALDWHRLESDLAAALRSAGADLPPVPPRMAP